MLLEFTRRYRMRELQTAYSLLAAMQAGKALQGMSLSNDLDASGFFAGRLAMGSACLMGHSYGGASVTALVAEDERFKCAIAYDPWWCVPATSTNNHGCDQ